MHRGIHALHGEVRALHETHLDARAARVDALGRPGREAAEGRQRVGQVGLQHDAGFELREPRVVEDAGEDRDRQVEVAVLLHVEVDERRRRAAAARSGEVERQQALDDRVDGLIEGPHRDVARDRRDLHRDVVDVVSADEVVDALEAAQRLVLAEHRLAEQVEVEPRPRLADLRERRTELVGARVDDEVADHLAQHPPRDRHDRRRQHGREGAAGADGGAQVPGQELRHEGRDALQVGCRGAARLGTHDAVDEPDREGQTVRVFEHAREPLGGRIGLHVGRFGDPALGERDRLVGEVGEGVVDGHISSLHCRHPISMRHAYSSTKAMIHDGYRSTSSMDA